MIRNNQNGRRRGRGGARPPQQGGGPSGNYGNTNGGGSRIDTRQRGNATQLLEKYKAMARDATQNGDRVQAEFYMQYADHYFRVLNEFRARDPQPAPRSTYDDDDDGYGASTIGQNYAPATERYDDEDEAAPAQGGDRGGNGMAVNGGINGGERSAYRSDGERPRGNGYASQGERPRADAYASQGERPRSDAYAGDRAPRTERSDDGGRQRGVQRAAAGDTGHSEVARRDDDQGEAPRRDVVRDGPRDGPRGEGRTDTARRDDGQGREAGRGYPRADGGRGDDGRRDGRGASRDGDGVRDSARRDSAMRDGGRTEVPREAATRNEAPRDVPSRNEAPREPELIGLPGPATLVPTFAAPEPQAAALADAADDAATPPAAAEVDAPVPRKRGRPRKVVVADSVDG